MTIPGSRGSRYDRLDLNEPLAPEPSPPDNTLSNINTISNTMDHSDNVQGESNGVSENENLSRDAIDNNDVIEDVSCDDDVPLPRPTATSSTTRSVSPVDTNTPLLPKNPRQQQQQHEEAEHEFVVVVLDGLHRKFRVPASPNLTVSEFKRVGASIHQVSPPAQRLIYMGKMLQDGSTLKSCGVTNTETIVHLFPKPTMVITDSNSSNNNEPSSQNSGSGGHTNAESAHENNNGDNYNGHSNSAAGSGAHVPQIVMDADEALRSSSMVIFTSSEMFEAQHRVKLFSFFLLFYNTLMLLSLISIMLGNPGDPYGLVDDEFSPGDPTDPNSMGGRGDYPSTRSWSKGDYIQLLISILGFYVSTLGIKAASENTLIGARRYFYGLLFVGLSWTIFTYVTDFKAIKAMDEAAADDDTADAISAQKVYIQVLFQLSLPICIWGVCFLRAYQFQRLVNQAEMEAVERHGRITRELERENSISSNTNEIAVAFGGVDTQEPSSNDRTTSASLHTEPMLQPTNDLSSNRALL